MKKILFFLILIPGFLLGQKITPLKKVYCNNKQRVYLVFPSKIDIIDISSVEVKYDVLGDKTMYLILSSPFFDDKNIVNGLIICSDDSHYPIEVRKGAEYISETTIRMCNEKGSEENVEVTEVKSIQEVCKNVMALKRNIFNLGTQHKGITTEIEGIAVDDSFVYIKVLHGNSSKINYNIDFNGLILKTQSKIKKIGNNDEYIEPVFVFNKTNVIPSKDKNIRSILVYNLFTLKDNQKVVYFLKEKNGGREVFVSLDSNALLKNSYNLKLNQ